MNNLTYFKYNTAGLFTQEKNPRRKKLLFKNYGQPLNFQSLQKLHHLKL